MPNEKYTIQGVVFDKKKRPVSDLVVRVFDAGSGHNQKMLGSAISDKKGRYKIDYIHPQTVRPLRKKDIIIIVYSSTDELLYKSKKHPITSQLTIINIALKDYLEDEGFIEKTYTFKGRVVNAKGVGIAGLSVEVSDIGIPGALNAGTAVSTTGLSQDDGSYESNITYKVSKSSSENQPDVIVKAFDSSSKELSQTKHYNISTVNKVNIVISADFFKEMSEFDKLNRALYSYLDDDMKIADIKEESEEQGITYLSRKTKWDARLVAMSVLAHRYADRSIIPAEFYYVLFRGGVSSSKDILYKTNVDKVVKSFKKAISNNIVSEKEYKLKKIKKEFQSKANQHILKSKSQMSISTMDEMLSLSLKEKKDKDDFVDLYYHGETDSDIRWGKIEDRFGKTKTNQLKLDGKLGYLSFNNATLIGKLTKELDLKDPIELIKNGFYKEDKWDAYIDDKIIPDVFEGDTSDAKRSNYKQWMTSQLKLSYPTAIIAEKINSDEIKISDDSSLKTEVYEALYKSDFTLGNTSINQHIDKLEDDSRRDIQLSDEAKKELKRIHRAYQLSPSDEAMKVLLDKKLDSAFKITRYDKKEFINKLPLSKEEAVLVYDKALMDASLISNMTMSYLTQAINPIPNAIGKTIQNNSKSPVKKYPKMDELFGNLDFCTCGHCESVLSPAAYLVDLLQFIDLSDKEHDGENPIKRLEDKRPDIENLELTCENTETVLPYIDLVNEILEYWIVHPDDASAPKIENTIEGFEGYNIEDGISSEVLLSKPQYINQSAYAKLSETVFPLSLPYDRDLELNRAYFNQFKTPLYQSMERLRKDEAFTKESPDYGWQEIFVEQLGLSQTAFEVLTDSKNYSVEALFGLEDSTDLNEALSNAKTFCKRTEIQYSELIELLKTEFVNPNIDNGGKIIILKQEGGSEDCNFEELELSYLDNTPLEDIEYLKLLRFIRLWKHLGLSVTETDKMIKALTDLAQLVENSPVKLMTLDNGFKDLLVKLALLARVKEAMSIKKKEDLEKLLILWGDIGRPKELTLLGISEIEGYQFLAQSLKISLVELFDLIILSDIDPLEDFNYLDTSGETYTEPNLLRFISLAQKVKASKFHISELNYLFSNKDVTGQASPTNDEFFGLLKSLHAGLKEIDSQYLGDGEISEDNAIALLTAIYGKEASDTIEGIFSKTRIFSTDYAQSSDVLASEIRSVDAGIEYDDVKKELSYKGIMSGSIRDELKDVIGVSTEFKNAIDVLYQQAEDLLSTMYPEFAAVYDVYETLTELISATLPPLIKQLKSSYIKQSLSDQLKIDVEMMALLLDTALNDSYLLHSEHEENIPMLSDFIALQSNGISALYYNGDTIAVGSEISSPMIIDQINFDGEETVLPLNSDDSDLNISAEWRFYLAPTSTSHYNLYLDVQDNATVSLYIDNEKISVDEADGIWRNQDQIYFEAGKIYEIKAEALNIKDTVVLKWKQGERIKESIPEQLFFPYQSVQDFKSSYTRLLKVLHLVDGLSLSSEEIMYFSDEKDLNSIPVKDTVLQTVSQNLFSYFLEIVDYKELKDQLNVEGNALVRFLDDPKAIFTLEDEEISVVYQIVRWDKDNVREIVEHLSGDPAQPEQRLSDMSLFFRTVKVFEILQKTTLSASNLLLWTTPFISIEALSQMQGTLQTQYDEESWLKFSQSINDKIRVSQRDALVSYILSSLQQVQETAHIDTADKLFEYFLIDVQMDACMKTSRIKQAISSVQLFIDRCLYNMEKGVLPESINAKQWEWMKRYRVWEANRKVFLHPENWLDPSLRTTKSPFFKEFEGELLQSDINDDLATKALLNYLEKVDRVSQLEICGICRENENRIHVIGKSSGMKSEYYHRRYDGTWSAWEKIMLDVEEGPVIPVFWKGRLFLFWTTILQKGQDNNEPSVDATDLSKFNGPAKVKIEVNLSWSEYYNHKWQEKRTTDYNDPIVFNIQDGEFKRDDVQLKYSVNNEDILYLSVIKGMSKGSFVFYNTQSLPQRNIMQLFMYIDIASLSTDKPKKEYLLKPYERTIVNNRGELSIEYGGAYADSVKHTVLNDYFYKTADFAHPLRDVFQEPFFLNDYKHAFFVNIEKKNIRLPFRDLIDREYAQPHVEGIPEIFEKPDLERIPDIVDPAPERMDPMGSAPYRDDLVSRVLSESATFKFDEVEIDMYGKKIIEEGNYYGK